MISNYLLNSNQYTLQNALCMGNCQEHYYLFKLYRGHRVICSLSHLLIAAIEMIPLIGQIASLIEFAIVNIIFYFTPSSKLHNKVLKPLPSPIQVIIHEYLGNDLSHLPTVNKKIQYINSLMIKKVNLTTIDFLEHWNDFPSPSFRNLVLSCPQITHLSISIPTYSANCMIKDIINLQNLIHLNLDGHIKFNPSELSYLTKLPQLLSLNLTFNNTLKESHFVELGNLKHLKILNFTQCNMSVDNSSLQQVAKITTLTHLNLSNCIWVSDEGLRYLTNLINLTSLDLTNCPRITDEGITLLSTSLPNIKIIR